MPADRNETRFEEGLGLETRKETKRPSLYRVVLLNDDYTTMEFVVAILVTIFHQSEAMAHTIMMHVHENGVGVAGIYTREIAETKVQQVTELARKNDFPLECTIEPE